MKNAIITTLIGGVALGWLTQDFSGNFFRVKVDGTPEVKVTRDEGELINIHQGESYTVPDGKYLIIQGALMGNAYDMVLLINGALRVYVQGGTTTNNNPHFEYKVNAGETITPAFQYARENFIWGRLYDA